MRLLESEIARYENLILSIRKGNQTLSYDIRSQEKMLSNKRNYPIHIQVFSIIAHINQLAWKDTIVNDKPAKSPQETEQKNPSKRSSSAECREKGSLDHICIPDYEAIHRTILKQRTAFQAIYWEIDLFIKQKVSIEELANRLNEIYRTFILGIDVKSADRSKSPDVVYHPLNSKGSKKKESVSFNLPADLKTPPVRTVPRNISWQLPRIIVSFLKDRFFSEENRVRFIYALKHAACNSSDLYLIWDRYPAETSKFKSEGLIDSHGRLPRPVRKYMERLQLPPNPLEVFGCSLIDKVVGRTVIAKGGQPSSYELFGDGKRFTFFGSAQETQLSYPTIEKPLII